MGMIPIPIFLGEVLVMKKKKMTSIGKCHPNKISLKPETHRRRKKPSVIKKVMLVILRQKENI